MNKIELLKENLINDFLEYLNEDEIEISTSWITNECYINQYLMQLHYTILDEVETIQELEEITNEFYNILDKYCCSNAIPLF